MTTTSTKTETETTVQTNLVEQVAEYRQDLRNAQSRLLPLTETAIDMLEHGRDIKQVGKDFRLAFAETEKLEAKGLSKNAEYREYSRRIREILTIAKYGRAWYQEHRAKETGFYRMYELAQAQSKPKPTPEPEVGDAPPWPPDIFIDVADEGQKFLNSKFFAKLATIVDSVEVEQGQTAECSEIVTILKRLIAVSSEALEKLS